MRSYLLLIVLASTVALVNPVFGSTADNTDKSVVLTTKVKDNPKVPIQEIEELLKEGADPSYKSSTSRPALFWAIAYSRLDIVELLLRYGAFIDMTYQDTGSPLVWSLQYGNYSIIDLLLSHGADPAIMGDETIVSANRNAYVLAANDLNDEKLLARLLKQTKSEDRPPLLVKFSCGVFRPSAAQISKYFPLFLSFEVNLNEKFKGKSVAECVARDQDIKSLQALLDQGADFSLISSLNRTYREEFLSFLIQHGAHASIDNLIEVMGTSRETLFAKALDKNEIYKGNPGIFAPFWITENGVTFCDSEKPKGLLQDLMSMLVFQGNLKMEVGPAYLSLVWKKPLYGKHSSEQARIQIYSMKVTKQIVCSTQIVSTS